MLYLAGCLLFLITLWQTCLTFAVGLAVPHSFKERLSRPQVMLFTSGVRSWIEWGSKFLVMTNQFH